MTATEMTRSTLLTAAPVTGEMAGELSALLRDPGFFPLRFDPQARVVVFAPMSRETFRRSSFLDERAILARPDSRTVGFDELLAALPSNPAQCPAHFILHGAFCGSTLLARSFEELPHCLVLKEPRGLAQLASLESAGAAGTPGSPMPTDWFDLVLTLLSRGDTDDFAVLIKAPDQFNWLGSRVLDRDRSAKIIFLAAPLRVFLLSALKSEDRRLWLRRRARGMSAQLPQIPFLSEAQSDELGDGQLGAALWLLNSFLCSQLLIRPDADRIMAMSSEDLVGQPRPSFERAVEFLGLTSDRHIGAALEAFRPLTYYSKEPDLRVHYDAKTRAADLAAIDRRFGREVDAAMAWAARVSAGWLPRNPFPFE